jgi:hypothetical protein
MLLHRRPLVKSRMLRLHLSCRDDFSQERLQLFLLRSIVPSRSLNQLLNFGNYVSAAMLSVLCDKSVNFAIVPVDLDVRLKLSNNVGLLFGLYHGLCRLNQVDFNFLLLFGRLIAWFFTCDW